MTDHEEQWGTQGILGFPINCQATLAHLNQDLRDDWFVDALQFRDLLDNQKSLKTVIGEILLESNGQYPGATRALFDVPKKGLGIRYALETDFYDRFVYQAICSFLIPYYDPLLSHRVLGHRYNKHRPKEKYLFKKRIELWKTFEGVTLTSLKTGKFLLATDLINYFENISNDLIKEKLQSALIKIFATGQEKLQIRNAISTLHELLEKWSYSGKHGLPQNRDASSFFANIVLNDIDQEMVARGYDYYRYVDDIRIVSDSETDAKRALTDLIFLLRTVGMNINSGKTQILSAADTEETISKFFPNNDDRSAKIEAMWKSRSRRVIARSVPLILEMLNDCIEQNETQSRQFRFAVNKFSAIIDSGLFDFKSNIATELIDVTLEALEDQPASSDKLCKILHVLEVPEEKLKRISNYLIDEQRSFHSWQNYHLWFLLCKKKYQNEDLIEFAVRKINENLKGAETPAIFIYLHCIGQSEKLKPAIERFSSDWPHSHQRHLLLATMDLPKEDLIPIIKQLGAKIKDTVRRAKPFLDENGHPLYENKDFNLLDVYEHISPYD